MDLYFFFTLFWGSVLSAIAIFLVTLVVTEEGVDTPLSYFLSLLFVLSLHCILFSVCGIIFRLIVG